MPRQKTAFASEERKTRAAATGNGSEDQKQSTHWFYPPR
jgi:hypothetical protein